MEEASSNLAISRLTISTEEQQTNAQTDALRNAGCEQIIEEKRSGGTLAKRPALLAMLAKLQPGDVVVCYKYDRIARSLIDLLKIQRQIVEAQAEFVSITESMDTSTPAGRMVFHILGAFAEFERELIRERTTVGLHAAMRRGAKPGRRAGCDRETVRAQWDSGQFTKSELAKLHGVHISSIKRAVD